MLKSDLREKPLDQSTIPLIALNQLQLSGVEKIKRQSKRGCCKLFSKGRYDGGLADRFMENHCCSSYYLAFAVCKKGIGRQHTTFILCQNNIFFLQRTDYALKGSTFWLSKCALFLPLGLYWEVVTCILICPQMQEHFLWPLLKRLRLNKLLGYLIFSKAPPGSEYECEGFLKCSTAFLKNRLATAGLIDRLETGPRSI